MELNKFYWFRRKVSKFVFFLQITRKELFEKNNLKNCTFFRKHFTFLPEFDKKLKNKRLQQPTENGQIY